MDRAITPAPDVLALRKSRIAVLERLIEFARRLIEEIGRRLATEGVLRVAGDYVRISRWLRVAIFLSWRIDQGALDTPREPRPARTRRAADADRADVDTRAAEGRSERDASEGGAELRPEREAREYERLECYLDRPFGEVVALICRGLGMKPDWAAWADEPWAQAEICARPANSPYADHAAAPPSDAADGPGSRIQAPYRAPAADPNLSPPPDAMRPPGLGPPPNRKARRAQARAARRRAQDPSSANATA